MMTSQRQKIKVSYTWQATALRSPFAVCVQLEPLETSAIFR